LEETSRVSMVALASDPSFSEEAGRLHRAERARAQSPRHVLPNEAAHDLDHFVERDGMRFAGTHLIIDLWQASGLDDANVVDMALRAAAEAAGATLLGIELHCFTPNGGITGIAVLAESHISIHTWPECAYAAVDVFMCGDARPYKASEVLRHAFRPRMLTIFEHRRGVMP
jgi:S-adenosylmethionine decarboxylase